jgi:phi13 family phage major tail protein
MQWISTIWRKDNMPNSGEFKSSVGLRDLYIAEVTQDDAAGYAAGVPVQLAPAASAAASPVQNFSTQYADDGAFDTINAEAETTIEIEVTAIPIETLANILGREYDAVSGRMYDTAAIASKNFALGFRSLKSNGSYRYFWYPKGSFNAPNEEMSTKGETAEPKLQKLTFKAIKTMHQFTLPSGGTDGVKRVVGDEDATNFDATGWFLQVQVPNVVAPAALALDSSVPADAAPGVAVGTNVTLTFNNPLPVSSVNDVLLVKADGTVVAGATTIDATHKIITINPTVDLAAGSTYICTYAVTDIYGQSLAGAINFGTA